MTTDLSMTLLTDDYTIHRCSADSGLSSLSELTLTTGQVLAVLHSDRELSVVCPASLPVMSEKQSKGWVCFEVDGPLDFSLKGILARISSVLANASISIFAVSSFDTDYVLVAKDDAEHAVSALTRNDIVINRML